jgi:hypothetical protein
MKKELTNIYKTFEKYLKWKKILDAWCWAWRDIEYFFSRWYEIKWIDISEWMFKNASHSIKDKFIVWDIVKLNKYFEENSLDWIWTIWWLVHLEKEIWKKVLKIAFADLQKIE